MPIPPEHLSLSGLGGHELGWSRTSGRSPLVGSRHRGRRREAQNIVTDSFRTGEDRSRGHLGEGGWGQVAEVPTIAWEVHMNQWAVGDIAGR